MWDNKGSIIFRVQQPLATDTAPLLNVLNHYHQRLENLFLCQQEALVEQRFELASQLLSHYQALLSAHIQLENSLLLPLHEKVEKPRWASSLYLREHEKILTLVSRAEEKLDAAQSEEGRSPRRGAIALLDYQRTIKGVLEHHEQREEQGLVPELSAMLDLSEEIKLAAQLEALWQQSFAERQDALNALLTQLDLDGLSYTTKL